MHKPFLSLLGLFSLLAATSVQAANAPSSLVGKKLVLHYQSNDGDSGTYTAIHTSDKKHWAVQDEGEWALFDYEWTSSSNTGTYKIIWDSHEYAIVNLVFTSTNAGTFTHQYWEANDAGQIELDHEGSGTFTVSTAKDSDIPSAVYFNDDFSDPTASQSLWPLKTEYGLTNQVKDGKFMVTGTLTDEDERWHETYSQSILSLEEDWTMEGTSFANVEGEVSTYHAAVLAQLGFNTNEGTNEAEFAIGLTPWGVLSEVYVSGFAGFASQYTSDSRESSGLTEGSFRIFNTASTNTLTSQYLKDGGWITIHEFNWETGLLTEKNSNSATVSTHQFTNWPTNPSTWAQPAINIDIPHLDQGSGNIQIIPLNEGDIGFTSFSVTEGAPTTAPSSLAGKLYQTQGGDRIQFLTDSTGTFHYAEPNFQQSEVSGITYTWTATGNNAGTLATDLDETTTLTFTSETGGSYDWRELSGDMDTGQGTFTLTDASTGYAPADLAGDSLISGTTTYVFKENGVVVVRSPNGSSESTYGYIKMDENAGVLAVPAQTTGVTSTFYKLSYSSTGQGSFSEGSSASFDYFVDRTNMPASKGWLWFDQYPWVYSNREGGWLYFVPSNGKINVYSVRDKAWREMTKTE